MSVVHKFLTIVFLLCILVIAGHCAGPEAEKILFDFESDRELDRFHWKCHTLFSLSDEHVVEGNKSLKLELYPSEYPGLAPKLAVNNWRAYRNFSFDVYNDQQKVIPLAIRIDDSKDYPDYPDRYNKTFNLVHGANTIVIPLDSLETSGTKRKLNLKNIYKIIVFVAQPDEKVVLFFDYFRLNS